MIKAGIIDDEPGARAGLQKNIEKYMPNKIKVIFAAASVREAVGLIKTHNPQLVFLDIEMPNENGFELFKHFENPDFKVVFTTAYKDHAINAIKHAAFDYLLKPVNHTELMELVNRIEAQKENSQFKFQLETLVTNLNNGAEPALKLSFPTQNGLEFIKANNIVFCQAENTYTVIYTVLNEVITVTKTLKMVEEMLPEKIFARIHKSYLVNINYIKAYTRSEGHGIKLENGMILPVGSAKVQEVMQLLKNN